MMKFRNQILETLEIVSEAGALTPSRWDQFWQKINQYGVPQLPKHQ